MTFLLLACHATLAPPATPTGPSGAAPRVYELAPGDNLTWVAQDFGVRGGWLALAALNGISNPHYVLAGEKIVVPTTDSSLPPVARLSAAAATRACPATPVPATGLSLSGCSSAACVDLGLGATACACAQPGGGKFLVQRPGHAPWTATVATTEAWWLDPDNVPEPSGTAALVAFRAQLDGDEPPETVVGWRHALSDLGMSSWTVLATDHDGTPTATFSAGNFGGDAIVRGRTSCELLATDWVMTDQPGHDADGWYLLGRQFSVGRDGLSPTKGAQVVARRLWDSYRPGGVRVGGVVTGTPGHDLGHASAFARSTDPELEVRRAGSVRWRVESAGRDAAGRLSFRHHGVTESVGDETSANAIARLGHRASGRLFPRDYAPGNPATLAGTTVDAELFHPTWSAPFAVAWLE